jgi:23S rRNA (guanosine2251-2'-O)-methyltransferase
MILKNPHSILAALETRPGDVESVRMPLGDAGEVWARIRLIASKNSVRIDESGLAKKPDSKGPRPTPSPDQAGREAMGEGRVRERPPLSLEEVLDHAPREGYGLWIALDQVQDPQNLGSIFRSAAFFGARGILLCQDRAAALTPVVYDVACGGVEHVPFAQVANLQRAIERAKEREMWVLGTSEHAKDSLFSQRKDRHWLLMLGNEEKGLRRLTQERCDLLCSIPCQGEVTSLNVSVAAGIAISRLS